MKALLQGGDITLKVQPVITSGVGTLKKVKDGETALRTSLSKVGGNEVIQAPTITIDKALQKAPWGKECLMICQVHDELLFDVRKKHLDNLLKLAYKEMGKYG